MIRELNGKTPDISKALFIAENAVIIGDVVLDEGTTVWYGAVIRGDTGSIRIGKNVNIQDNTIVHTELNGRVEIADNVTIGHSCIIHSCRIGSNCMIGMGSIVMNDSEIGDNTLVAAGSLVTERKKYTGNDLIMGSPARVIKKITSDQINMIANSVEEYTELGRAYKNGTEFYFEKH